LYEYFNKTKHYIKHPETSYETYANKALQNIVYLLRLYVTCMVYFW